MVDVDTGAQITSLVVQNVPVEYTQDELFDEMVRALGSSDVPDFFYLPWDENRGCNVGYAYATFLNQEIVQRAFHIFCNYRFRAHNRGLNPRLGKVAPASIQGLETIIWHFQECAQEGRRFGPIVVWNGHKIELSKVFEQLQVQGVGLLGCDVPEADSVPQVDFKPSDLETLAMVGISPHVARCVEARADRFRFAAEALGPAGLGPGRAPQPQPQQLQVGQLRPLRGAAQLAPVPEARGLGQGPCRGGPAGGGAAGAVARYGPPRPGPGAPEESRPRHIGTNDRNDGGVVEITVPSAQEDALRRFAGKFGHSL